MEWWYLWLFLKSDHHSSKMQEGCPYKTPGEHAPNPMRIPCWGCWQCGWSRRGLVCPWLWWPGITCRNLGVRCWSLWWVDLLRCLRCRHGSSVGSWAAVVWISRLGVDDWWDPTCRWWRAHSGCWFYSLRSETRKLSHESGWGPSKVVVDLGSMQDNNAQRISWSPLCVLHCLNWTTRRAQCQVYLGSSTGM